MNSPLEVIRSCPPHDYSLNGVFASRMQRDPQRPFIAYEGRTWSGHEFDGEVLRANAVDLQAAAHKA